MLTRSVRCSLLERLASSAIISQTRAPNRCASSLRAPRWKRYKLSSQGVECSSSSLTDDGYVIKSDTPPGVGGGGSAPQPVQLLLAALVGCEQATAHFLAHKLRMPPIKRIHFELEAERDEWGSMAPPVDVPPPQPSHLQRVWGTVTVDTEGSAADVQKLAAIVKVRCPVASMIIASGCKLDVTWIKQNSTEA